MISNKKLNKIMPKNSFLFEIIVKICVLLFSHILPRFNFMFYGPICV